MEINNLNASAAYTNASTAPPVNDTQLRNQNIESSNAHLDTATTNAVQEAFEVTLTQEAQTLQAQNSQQTNDAQQTEDDAVQAQATQTQTQDDIAPSNEASQIVNIVA